VTNVPGKYEGPGADLGGPEKFGAMEMRNLAFYMFILYPGPDPQSAALCMGLHFVEKMTISTKLTVAYCARNM